MGPQEKEANVGYEHKREKREREGRKDGGGKKEKVTEEVTGGNNTSRHLWALCGNTEGGFSKWTEYKTSHSVVAMGESGHVKDGGR